MNPGQRNIRQGRLPPRRLKLAIVDQGIFSNVNNARFSISLARLAAVYFDERARRTSIAVSQMPRSGCHYAELRYQDQVRLQHGTPATAILMAVPARPTIIGKITDRLLVERSIALFWNVGTRQEAVVVNINECEYGPFLSILQDATGARWAELKREWSTIRLLVKAQPLLRRQTSLLGLGITGVDLAQGF